ncbi:MAG: Peptidase, M23/M37 family [candidate division NC10 bacterium CSP1-5]|nr:MAG: Peptidase, M23/M37 family [candidate division NC10 bacterium CSP1-5]
MAPRFLTILFLTDATTSPRQVRLSQRALGGVLVGGVLTLLVLGYIGIHFLTVEVDYLELIRLRHAVQAQQEMAQQLETLSQEMTRLRTFDTQIRRLAGMQAGPAAGAPTLAVGGGTLELAKALKEGEQAEQVLLLARLYQDLERLEREIALRAESLQAVTEYLMKQKDRLTATPALWPTEGHVTSPFGPRTSPFTGQPQQHTGVDIAAPPGTPIRAPADGIVTFAGTLPGYGHALVLTHGFGFKTFYGHNQRNQVSKGQTVKRGQVIALVGNTGYSTGAHLHYEVLLNDQPHNPLKYIVDEGQRANVIRGQ